MLMYKYGDTIDMLKMKPTIFKTANYYLHGNAVVVVVEWLL